MSSDTDPDHAVAAEESGTNNFAAGIPTFGMAVTLTDADGPLVTCVGVPVLGDVYLAELAGCDEYVERLAEYNVDLVQAESVRRPIGDHMSHFEHGHQRDANNRIDDWESPRATPLGYYFNTLVTSQTGRLSDRGRYNWLKDIQAVTPTERIPVWLFSKYFYREMNPLLRYALVPFLLLSLPLPLPSGVRAGSFRRPPYSSWTVTSTEPSPTAAVIIVVRSAGAAPVTLPGLSSRTPSRLVSRTSCVWPQIPTSPPSSRTVSETRCS
jgi:hypothetical protein